MYKLKSDKTGLTTFFKNHPHKEGIIVSEQKKFIYMKPTKTAGTSILRHFLEKEIKDIFHLKDHPKEFLFWLNAITDKELEEYFIFAVVRNIITNQISGSLNKYILRTLNTMDIILTFLKINQGKTIFCD